MERLSNYREKYLKYKSKYLELKKYELNGPKYNMKGGALTLVPVESIPKKHEFTAHKESVKGSSDKK